MSTVLLVILLIISVIMTGLILIQRSEGGALGIGGGGGGGAGGFMSGRAATTSIARATAILGTVFLVLSLLLSVVFRQEFGSTSRLDVDNEVGGLTSAPDSDQSTTPLEDPVAPDDVPLGEALAEDLPADTTDTDD